MPLIYDFKDIASRMKGELKQEPEPCKHLPVLCSICRGSGLDPGKYWTSRCHRCSGTGVEP